MKNIDKVKKQLANRIKEWQAIQDSNNATRPQGYHKPGSLNARKTGYPKSRKR